MAKGPKFRVSFLNTFKLCSSNDIASQVKTPLPKASYLFSPINSKSFDLSFPRPSPPPSSPIHPSTKRNVATSRINPLGHCKCLSESCSMHEIPSELLSTNYSYTRKEIKGKTYTSSTTSNDHSLNEDESFNGQKYPLKKRTVRTQRFTRFGSKEWKDGEIGKPVSRKSLVPCMVDENVNESFVVVKKSIDPFEDFKKSMLEMIMEKQMSEPRELEELLMSFLSLNSRVHHQVIIKAFMEIWKEVLFVGSSHY